MHSKRKRTQTAYAPRGVNLALAVSGRPDQSRDLLFSSFQESVQMVDQAYQHTNARRSMAQSPMQMFTLLRQPASETLEISKAAEVFEMTLHLIKAKASRRHKRAIALTEYLSVEEVELIANWSGCPAPVQPACCPYGDQSSKYRSIDGVCNNRNNPLWGAANTVLARWLPAEYEDGKSQPKGWNAGRDYGGFQLPPVREVSNRIMQGSPGVPVLEDEDYSQMLVDWGQYMDHDISFTPQSSSRAAFPSGLDCLSTCANANPCFPIEIPPNDQLFTRKSCLPFFRSSPACPSTAETSGPHRDLQQMLQRQQTNVITSFLDASTVYGHSPALQGLLRDRASSAGMLAVNHWFADAGGRPFLPSVAPDTPSACFQEHCAGGGGGGVCGASDGAGRERVECFLAGDSRVNEVLPLTALHTLWVREHNRVAATLKALNPQWSAETTYQESRKIIGALHQIITMRDYVPKIIGQKAFDRYVGPYRGYNDSVNPSVSNVFATAAFRFGHATIPTTLRRLNESFQDHPLYPSLPLHRTFFSPWRIVRQGGLDPVIRGLLAQPAAKVTRDHLMSQELTERLVVLTVPETLDLAALNLQRGRDHALPGYNEWRSFCGFDRASTPADLGRVINDGRLVEKIMELYGNPDNIDVWLGGLLEEPLPGARTGPLFACLIGKQMKALGQGDRFWWESPGVFTQKQREELMKHSLPRVICDNSGIEVAPPDAFRLARYPQDFLPCNSVPSMNLEAWRES
ncbi:thyroid peroxidase [Alosa pseudoharengus]|uniref:thyroid peroxidase n=1 Tax=Alosa pseudoharengus TaxID=34774 RepID=UPI003F8C199E